MSQFTVKQFSAFLKALKKEGVTCLHDANEESITVQETFEGFLLEFVLHYNTRFKNHLPATHFQPEEFDTEFENTGFTEIAVYKDEEVVDLAEAELLSIEAILESILY